LDSVDVRICLAAAHGHMKKEDSMDKFLEKILKILEQVKDPEIPVLNVVEMGIVRGAKLQDETLVVTITPTYSGCPAMQEIENEILSTLKDAGYNNSKVRTSFTEPWTSDWMTSEAKQKLKDYGIAPPGAAAGDSLVIFPKPSAVPCPFCDSSKTELRTNFSSTACKSLHYCKACEQPFEQFKAI